MQPTSLQVIRDEHAALAAMLLSLQLMVERGPGDEPESFFDVVRAMLFYIDEFPEKLHHPMESNVLFPRVARLSPQTRPLIERLDRDHMKGESAVREADAAGTACLAWTTGRPWTRCLACRATRLCRAPPAMAPTAACSPAS